MPTRVMNNNCGGGVEAGGFFMEKRVVFKDVEKNGLVKNISNFSDESSSSSIGKNSDLSENLMEGSCDIGGEEVQSSYKNKGPLDAMEALEQVLPIRRGISSFYNGKSKSFTILSDVSSLSSSSIAKPDNAYTRKRRNQLSSSLHLDKNRTSCLKINNNNGTGSGISKRPTGLTRTTLALGLAMGTSETGKRDGESDLSSWRSFSLADLQQHWVPAANTGSNSSTLDSKS